MSAIEDLTELVERAGAAERAALASKWKERSDVEALQRKVRHAIDDQRDLERRGRAGTAPPRRWAQLREVLLEIDLDGREPAGGAISSSRTVESPAPARVGHDEAAQAEAD